ncbi:MAG TPA: hypothetical protein VFG95_05860 [Nitrospiria bacterium]|nr:hypothetical protein [Nitrospiria bacterium]
MSLGRFLENILETPGKWKWVKRLFYASMVLVVALDFIAPRHHAFFFWDEIPGYSAVYGFISCVLIIVVSKFLGHYWLMKREDYYD